MCPTEYFVYGQWKSSATDPCLQRGSGAERQRWRGKKKPTKNPPENIRWSDSFSRCGVPRGGKKKKKNPQRRRMEPSYFYILDFCRRRRCRCRFASSPQPLRFRNACMQTHHKKKQPPAINNKFCSTVRTKQAQCLFSSFSTHLIWAMLSSASYLPRKTVLNPSLRIFLVISIVRICTQYLEFAFTHFSANL